MTACISEGLNVTMTLVITRCPMPTPWTHHAGLICHLSLRGLVPLHSLTPTELKERPWYPNLTWWLSFTVVYSNTETPWYLFSHEMIWGKSQEFTH